MYFWGSTVGCVAKSQLQGLLSSDYCLYWALHFLPVSSPLEVVSFRISSFLPPPKNMAVRGLATLIFPQA